MNPDDLHGSDHRRPRPHRARRRPRPPTTLTVRSPEDLLAIAPSVLGFWPEESVVLLTFGADRPFHGRIDLPPRESQTPQVVAAVIEALLAPAERHRVERVVVLYYTADDAAAAHLHGSLRRALRRQRIGLVAALVADGAHYQDLHQPVGEREAVAYDVRGHPFVLDAVLAGRLTHRSRGDLAGTIACDEAAASAVDTAIATLGLRDAGVPQGGRDIRDAGDWVRATVADLVAREAEPGDDEVARLVWVMQEVRVRDAAWSTITGANAAAHVTFWTDVVRRSPDALVAAPAALLGWSAWQAGDGARAWTAIDRCRAAAPDYRLADYLAVILEHAVPPDLWTDEWDWTLGLPPSAA